MSLPSAPVRGWSLDELRYVTGLGRLVPFLGSGMSRPVCCTWADMITGLEGVAAGYVGFDRLLVESRASRVDDLDLTRRAARALEVIRLNGGVSGIAAAVRQALLTSEPQLPPASTKALARLPWPLVMTTNYDDLYAAAVHQRLLGERIGSRTRTSDVERRTPPVEVVGRSPIDCHRVLTSLRSPTVPLLWALQGFLPGQALIRTRHHTGEFETRSWRDYALIQGLQQGRLTELEHQVVVGHAEYRSVTMRSESFRRAFAEVCRSRSLLFLGSGLRDRYLLDLFSQVAELYGPSSQQHYAVMPKGEVDPQFLRRYFGIWVKEVSSTDEIPDLLNMVGDDDPRLAITSIWHSPSSRPDSTPTLKISSAPLRRTPQGACVVVSGGGSMNWPRLSQGIREYLVESGVLPSSVRGADHETIGRLFELLHARSFTWGLRSEAAQGRSPTVLVARARLDAQSSLGRRIRPLAPGGDADPTGESAGRLGRDLRLIKPVTEEALRVARDGGCSHVMATLLGTGSLTSLPPSFVLQEMVSAWNGANPGNLPMEIYVTDQAAITDLHSGRVDLGYLLSPRTHDDGAETPRRFWLEIVHAGGTERILEARDPVCGVRTLLSEYWLDQPDWLIDVWPRPCLGYRPWTLELVNAWEFETKLTMTLDHIGVFHGSTLQILGPMVDIPRPR